MIIGIISGKAERDERWEYPLIALREIVLNALVHRDYSDDGNIQVRIFDNSIEIWSPGFKALHGGRRQCRCLP